MKTGQRIASLLLLSTAIVAPGTALAQSSAAPPNAAAQPDPEIERQAAMPEQPQGVDDTAPVGEEDFQEPDVSVPGGGVIVVTGRRGPRDVTRSSSQVVSVLSAEDIARTGEGDIAGALSRVTGLSDNGDGRVFVRGLGDRYSLALLNGLPLPSPQPLSRVVPLDIFPTNIVASSLVQKTYSANFPGEFGGGVINLTTRAIPDETFLKISAGISGDTITTGSNSIQHYGSDYDWFGFDDGRRDVPGALANFFAGDTQLSDLALADQQVIAKDLISPNLIVLQKVDKTRPNFSGGLTAGTSVVLGDSTELGVIATANLSNSLRTRNRVSQTPDSLDLNLRTDFDDFITNNRILANALIGFGLETGEQQFRWTNLFIRDSLKQSVLSRGEDIQNGDSEVQQSTGWFERQLLDSQFVGEMELAGFDIDVRAGYAQTDREAPYEYAFEYVRTNNGADPFGDQFVNPLNRIRGDLASVAFSDLTEKLWYGGIDLSYPIADLATLTVGYARTDTDRRSSRREFIFDSDSSFPTAVGLLRPDLLLGDAIIEAFDVQLFETTQTFPEFQADLEIDAAYAKAVVTPAYGLTVDLGVRYEDAVQSVTPVQIFANQQNLDAVTNIANDYWLPAATLTYEFDNGLQLRLNGSKTIARPQFRELIFQPFTDPESNRQFVGNPALQDSELLNFEARAEYYFANRSRVSLAGFYKEIDNPIEPFSSFTDNDQVTQFANAPKAELFGGEIETQWNYDLADMGGWFETKQLVVVANYTYTQSELKVGADDQTFTFTPGVGGVPRPASGFFVDGAPLTGQSDHLVNFQLGIEDVDKLQQLTLLVKYASERVTSRGSGGLPDIVEDPGLTIDLVGRSEIAAFGQPLEISLEARNLTGRDNFEFQSNGTNRIEINSYAVGRTFALGVSTEF